MHGTGAGAGAGAGAGGHCVEPEANDDRSTAHGGLRLLPTWTVAAASGRQPTIKTSRRNEQYVWGHDGII
jgi:hypothetical protein